MDTCPHCHTELTRDTLFCPRCGKRAPGSDQDELLASLASDPTGLLDRLRTATAGEFKIVRELGRGGMGRVYLAHEVTLDRRVALKVLPPALSESPEVVERFQREARTAGKLNHPNIVAVYQVSERAGLHFFTMPYVAGPSVRQILKQTPQLAVELCRRYLREAADALAYAHGRGVIHRDIKPENMLLEGSRDGRLMLTDFGIAKALGAATTLTRPGDMMGTPYFMSPEQCGGGEQIDGRADQYSLGLVAYEMLAGRFPFSADSLAGIVYKHLHEYPEPLEKIRPDVPADLRAVIERAIRKQPEERFPNMGEFLEALGAALPSRKTAGQARTAPATPRSRPRRRARWLAVGAIAALAIAAGGFALWQQRASTGQADPQFAQITLPPPEEEGVSESAGTVLDSTAREPAGPGDVEDSGSRTATRSGDDSVRGATPEPAAAGLATERAAERARAQEARSEAQRARDAAERAGADTIFPARFQEVDASFRGAASDLREDRLVTAAISFATAKRDFEELERRAVLRLRQLAAAAAATDSAAADQRPPDAAAARDEQGGAANEPEAPEPVSPVTPGEAISALIDGYRQALETADMRRLRQEVYQAAIPDGNPELYKLWFERATDLSVSVAVEDMDISLDDARVSVRQRMRYRLDRTGEWRNWDVSLRMFFARTADGWRLDRVER